MINPVTGELNFDQLVLKPHQLKQEIDFDWQRLRSDIVAKANNPTHGFTTLFFATVSKDYGEFDTQLTFDPDNHFVLATLCHQHEFYVSGTLEDSERRAFHDSIVAKDLNGQTDFGWGQIRHFFCDQLEIDYLAIIYSPGTNVPTPDGLTPKVLAAAENGPEDKEKYQKLREKL